MGSESMNEFFFNASYRIADFKITYSYSFLLIGGVSEVSLRKPGSLLIRVVIVGVEFFNWFIVNDHLSGSFGARAKTYIFYEKTNSILVLF